MSIRNIKSTMSIRNIKSSMFHSWSNRCLINVNNQNDEEKNNENKEEESPILLMERTKDKMDKLQEELDNVRRDFLKFSSLHSSGSNPDVGVKIESNDGEEGMMPEN